MRMVQSAGPSPRARPGGVRVASSSRAPSVPKSNLMRAARPRKAFWRLRSLVSIRSMAMAALFVGPFSLGPFRWDWGSERDVVVLLPGVLKLLVAQHGQRPAQTLTGVVRHDH